MISLATILWFGEHCHFKSPTSRGREEEWIEECDFFFYVNLSIFYVEMSRKMTFPFHHQQEAQCMWVWRCAPVQWEMKMRPLSMKLLFQYNEKKTHLMIAHSQEGCLQKSKTSSFNTDSLLFLKWKSWKLGYSALWDCFLSFSLSIPF